MTNDRWFWRLGEWIIFDHESRWGTLKFFGLLILFLLVGTTTLTLCIGIPLGQAMERNRENFRARCDSQGGTVRELDGHRSNIYLCLDRTGRVLDTM